MVNHNKSNIQTIEIKGKEYNYSLRKSKKVKRARLQIYPSNGLEVVIPYWYSENDLNHLLSSNSEWIKKNLEKIAKVEDSFLFFGSQIEVLINNLSFRKNYYFYFDNKKQLTVIVPEENVLTKNELYHIWLKKEAQHYIPQRVSELAKKYGFEFNRVTIREQKSRWGSCSSKKNLSFNSKLLYFNHRIIDYELIHELCHLKEMNHSKRFWNLVNEIMPDYKVHKRALNNLT